MGALAASDIGSFQTRLLDLRASRATLDAWAATLSDEERARAARFQRPNDRDRFVARRAGLRAVLAKHIGGDPAALDIQADAMGKLYLSDAPDLHFNLSSSGGFALVVTADTPVGCDIERRDPAFACPKVAERLFTDAENAELHALPADLWVSGFFNCWTRKEAYVKALGQGLSLPLDSFGVSLDPRAPAYFTSAAPGWALYSFEPVPGYQAAVVAGIGASPP
ncbi:4'-phosphopantetheinyl transferase family protein [Stakelama marina]|uniref:4'-phosphopantetheinyl transferase superfamily protein n=1 Tax=Stakelama marina TaxID=2826939 RepID=A0A8T4ICD6_9SPHN|nr:4'-phosphopantetheinyl transferase superfamily protein [Stakelama marina]MBR0552698.1 4'-phosphopantetheinyl transferase superfamily protein [Stakelama marina]